MYFSFQEFCLWSPLYVHVGDAGFLRACMYCMTIASSSVDTPFTRLLTTTTTTCWHGYWRILKAFSFGAHRPAPTPRPTTVIVISNSILKCLLNSFRIKLNFPILGMAGLGMTKKAPPLPRRQASRFSFKLLIIFCVSLSLCAFAFFNLHSQSEVTTSTPYSRRRSRISLETFDGPPKIAFMFLARRQLPLDFLWETFFEVRCDRVLLFKCSVWWCSDFCFFLCLQNGDVANFSIYVHSAPGFAFDESTTRSHYFYGRQLSNSIQVKLLLCWESS